MKVYNDLSIVDEFRVNYVIFKILFSLYTLQNDLGLSNISLNEFTKDIIKKDKFKNDWGKDFLTSYLLDNPNFTLQILFETGFIREREDSYLNLNKFEYTDLPFIINALIDKIYEVVKKKKLYFLV